MHLDIVTPVDRRDVAYLRRAADSIYRAALSSLAEHHQIVWHVIGDTHREIDETDVGLCGHQVRIYEASSRNGEGQVGPGNARNAVIQTLPDDHVICFLDADDELGPDSLGPRLQNFVAGDPRFLYGPCIRREEGKPLIPVIPPPADMIDRVIEQRNCLIPIQVMVTAGLVKRAGGFEPDLICGEDGNLWRRILRLPELKVANTFWGVCGTYTFRRDSQSKALYAFNPNAWHLDPKRDGPTGQKLDRKAWARAASGVLADVELEIVAACGTVKV